MDVVVQVVRDANLTRWSRGSEFHIWWSFTSYGYFLVAAIPFNNTVLLWKGLPSCIYIQYVSVSYQSTGSIITQCDMVVTAGCVYPSRHQLQRESEMDEHEARFISARLSDFCTVCFRWSFTLLYDRPEQPTQQTRTSPTSGIDRAIFWPWKIEVNFRIQKPVGRAMVSKTLHPY